MVTVSSENIFITAEVELGSARDRPHGGWLLEFSCHGPRSVSRRAGCCLLELDSGAYLDLYCAGALPGKLCSAQSTQAHNELYRHILFYRMNAI